MHCWNRNIGKLLHTFTRRSYFTREAEQNCLGLIEACNAFPKLTQVHAHLIKSGLQNNLLVLTKFASISSDLSEPRYASMLLFSPEADKESYDTFLYNTIVRGYAQTSDSKATAVLIYNLMRQYGVLPNKFTYPFVLKACAGIGELNLGKSVHGSVLKFGFDDDVHVQNTMVHMYCCCGGSVEVARKVFEEMSERDSVAWSAMIGGYARLGRSVDAIDLFKVMQTSSVIPDDVTMVSVLTACTDLGELELGKWIESYILREKVKRSIELSNALIDMFAKCGDADKAMNLFRNMSEHTIVSWTSVIAGLGIHGRGLEAVSLFEEMIKKGMVPDYVVFVGLLSACSHSGLVDIGKDYFNSMSEKFGIVPTIEHYGCMVDMLCRAELVEDAMEFVQNMPIEPNQIILRTLISACHAPGELKVGERITERLITKNPMDGTNYVLLSNVYAKMLQWKKKNEIREVMDKKGMKKTAGSSTIR